MNQQTIDLDQTDKIKDQKQDQKQAQKQAQKQPIFLQALGVVGWDHLEAPILASIVQEKPLLLIGEHGTAKSMVLERLAAALGVQFRHYNASILNFDDLIGFPAPDTESGRVRYLRSNLDAWDAEAIFVDEISRCRPDMQNRLFPLIYDRKLQGASLKNLKYRWSAMNPPPSEDDPNRYFGSFALDDAFADRYDWILRVPSDLSPQHRLKVIKGTVASDSGAYHLQKAIQHTKSKLNLVEEVYGDNVALFFDSLYPILKRREWDVSMRRIRMMYQNAIAMIATGYYATIADALYRTVLYSLPQNTNKPVTGKDIQPIVSMALKIKALAIMDIRKQLLEEKDPIKRIVLALQSEQEDLMVATILDSYASLSRLESIALAVKLFPILVEKYPKTPGIVLAQLAEDVAVVQALQSRGAAVPTHSVQYKIAQCVIAQTANLNRTQVWIEDVLWVGFEERLFDTVQQVRDMKAFCTQTAFILNKLGA